MRGGVILSKDTATAEPTPLVGQISGDVFQEIGRDRDSIFERIAEDGERYFPHRFREGLYRVADPALGRTKHHAANQIAIRGEEIEIYLERGFLLRMRGEVSGQVNLIASSEIKNVR